MGAVECSLLWLCWSDRHASELGLLAGLPRHPRAWRCNVFASHNVLDDEQRHIQDAGRSKAALLSFLLFAEQDSLSKRNIVRELPGCSTALTIFVPPRRLALAHVFAKCLREKKVAVSFCQVGDRISDPQQHGFIHVVNETHRVVAILILAQVAVKTGGQSR